MDIGADTLLILTTVEKVYRDFGRPSQKELENLNLDEAKALLQEGHFGEGSMEPKIRAAIQFLQECDQGAQRKVFITLPETAISAMQGKTGTRIAR